MLGIAGLITAGLGATFAQMVHRFPADRAALVERSAGALMIGGLMLLGSTLPEVIL